MNQSSIPKSYNDPDQGPMEFLLALAYAKVMPLELRFEAWRAYKAGLHAYKAAPHVPYDQVIDQLHRDVLDLIKLIRADVIQ
jgi:hypothetical protein